VLISTVLLLLLSLSLFALVSHCICVSYSAIRLLSCKCEIKLSVNVFTNFTKYRCTIPDAITICGKLQFESQTTPGKNLQRLPDPLAGETPYCISTSVLWACGPLVCLPHFSVSGSAADTSNNNKKAVLSQRWPRDARYISRSWAIWNFSKMAAAAILDLFEPEIAPLDPPSPKTPPYNKTWSGSDHPWQKYMAIRVC